VTLQHLAARRADLRPVPLQTAEDGENVIPIGLQFSLAEPDHIRMTGGALSFISGHRWGRRLRWELRHCDCPHDKQER
jgi:hypothetical protein